MTEQSIASPCHESWEGMTPDGRGRHCASCAKTVIDVTAMPPAEGRTFVAKELPTRLANGERVCVRAHADARGRLLRPGVRRYLLTNGLAAVLAMTIAGCGAASAVSTGEPAPPKSPPSAAPASPTPMMGKPRLPQPVHPQPVIGAAGPGEVAPASAPMVGEVCLPAAPEATVLPAQPSTTDARDNPPGQPGIRPLMGLLRPVPKLPDDPVPPTKPAQR